jgi:hypothetical protein
VFDGVAGVNGYDRVLDLIIQRDVNNFSIDTYRKPTYTDSIITIDSCHPIEHKYAAIRYLQNRLNSYQVSHEKRDKECRIIQDILHNNGYNTSVLKSISSSSVANTSWRSVLERATKASVININH